MFFPSCGNARSPWLLTKALVQPACHRARWPRRPPENVRAQTRSPTGRRLGGLGGEERAGEPGCSAPCWTPATARRARVDRGPQSLLPGTAEVAQQPAPVFLPGESQGRKRLAGYGLFCKERERKKKKKTLAEICTLYPNQSSRPHDPLSSPTRYSCLESSRDRGAWRATVHSGKRTKTLAGMCTLYPNQSSRPRTLLSSP